MSDTRLGKKVCNMIWLTEMRLPIQSIMVNIRAASLSDYLGFIGNWNDSFLYFVWHIEECFHILGIKSTVYRGKIVAIFNM